MSKKVPNTEKHKNTMSLSLITCHLGVQVVSRFQQTTNERVNFALCCFWSFLVAIEHRRIVISDTLDFVQGVICLFDKFIMSVFTDST